MRQLTHIAKLPAIYTPVWGTRINEHDYKGSIKKCENIKEKAYTEICYRGIGHNMAHFKNDNLKEVESILAGESKIIKNAFYKGYFSYLKLSKDIIEDYKSKCVELENKEDRSIYESVN